MAQFATRVVEPRIRSKLNATGSTILKGIIVNQDTDADEVVVATGATDAYLGVAMADIPTGEWGDIQVGGVAAVRGGAAVTIGARVMADGDGEGIACTAGNSVLGIALTTGADNALFEVDLDAQAARMPG